MSGLPLEIVTGYRPTGPGRMSVRLKDGALAINLVGSIDQAMVGRIRDAVSFAATDRVGAVALVIDVGVSTWDIGPAACAVYKLRDKGINTMAYVRTALGSAVLLASACEHVWASPFAEIGLLRARRRSWLPWRRASHEHDSAMRGALCCYRPRVESAAWCALLHRTADAWQAEAFGIVDGVGDETRMIDHVFRRGVHQWLT